MRRDQDERISHYFQRNEMAFFENYITIKLEAKFHLTDVLIQFCSPLLLFQPI